MGISDYVIIGADNTFTDVVLYEIAEQLATLNSRLEEMTEAIKAIGTSSS